jgi:hypothetical protein
VFPLSRPSFTTAPPIQFDSKSSSIDAEMREMFAALASDKDRPIAMQLYVDSQPMTNAMITRISRDKQGSATLLRRALGFA